MERLEPPYEIFELKDGETRDLEIIDYKVGEMTIHPKDGRPPKDIRGLRVHVPKVGKEFFPYYWDITSTTLTAQLLPLLEQGLHKTRRFRITKRGVPPMARFTLEVV